MYNIKKIIFFLMAMSAILLASCNSSNNNNSTPLNNNSKSAALSSKNLPITIVTAYADEKTILIGGGVGDTLNGVIYISNNVVNWNITSIDNLQNTPLYGFAKNSDGILAAVGLNSTILKSFDNGNTWQQTNTKISCNNSDNCNLLGITAYQNRFVAVGDFGTIITSTDGGTTWKKVDSDTIYGLNAVTVDTNGRFIAVGLNGVIVTSSDGINWNMHEPISPHALRSIAVDSDGTFVAVGDSLIIISKDGGNSWLQSTYLPKFILYSITVNDNNQFVAVGEYGTVISSQGDDVYGQWQRYISKAGVDLYGVTYSKKHQLYTAVGGNGIMIFSADGTTWSSDTSIMKRITQFSINGRPGKIDGESITVVFPYGTNLNSLKASFTINGYDVMVNNQVQISGQTIQDFTKPITYAVYASDGSKRDYLVTATADYAAYAYISTTDSYIEKCLVNATDGSLTNCVNTNVKNLNNPNGIGFIDNTTILIANTNNNMVMKCYIDSADGSLSNCVDSGAKDLDGPIGITINNGKIYITSNNHKLSICEETSGKINCSTYSSWWEFYKTDINNIAFLPKDFDPNGYFYALSIQSDGSGYIAVCPPTMYLYNFCKTISIEGNDIPTYPWDIAFWGSQNKKYKYLYSYISTYNENHNLTKCAVSVQLSFTNCNPISNFDSMGMGLNGIATLNIDTQAYFYGASPYNSVWRCEINTETGDLEECIATGTAAYQPVNIRFLPIS